MTSKTKYLAVFGIDDFEFKVKIDKCLIYKMETKIAKGHYIYNKFDI